MCFSTMYEFIICLEISKKKKKLSISYQINYKSNLYEFNLINIYSLVN